MDDPKKDRIFDVRAQQGIYETLQSLIDLHGIIIKEDRLTIPEENMYYTRNNNNCTILFNDIASLIANGSYVHIVLQNGYQYSFSKTDPMKICLFTHQVNISQPGVTPQEIASNIHNELTVFLEAMR